MRIDFRDEWIDQLGQRLNHPGLKFDPDGLCQLSLDNELAVTIYKRQDTNDLVLFGQLPMQHFSPELMQKMLIENRNHAKQTAAVLSIAEDADAIEVHFQLGKEELETTDDALGILIDSLEYWRNYITS